MSNTRFFSNTIILLDHAESAISISPKNTRSDWQQEFEVPEHNVGTNNLMIFLDGKLCLPTIDYTDINSYHIKFKIPIGINVDFEAILIKTSESTISTSGNVKWEEF